jgi:NAD/NADP transhydrogenase beta subunit
MKLPKLPKVTPLGLISSILVVGGLAGAILGVDARYFRTDAAKSMEVNLAQTQQQNRVETDLSVVKLEINFLESQLAYKKVRPDADISITQTNARLKFLNGKRDKLEEYQLHLEPQ